MMIEEEQKKKQRKTIKEFLSQIGPSIVTISKQIVFFCKFLVLLVFVFIKYFLGRGSRRKLNKPISKIRINLEPLQKSYEKFYVRVIKIFDTSKPQEVKSADLIYLAMRNLSYKRNRTYVTIVGMAIGFGAVILLLSLGFGFERLVVSRVASLSEMKQIDVSSSQNSLLSFDSNSIAKIKEIPKVEAILDI